MLERWRLLVSLGLIASWVGCQPKAANSRPQSSFNNVADIPILHLSLGTINPGGDKTERFTFKNPRSQSVALVDVQTSCPCLSVSPLPVRIEAGAEQVLSLRFDGRSEPDFRGKLLMTLTGRGSDGSVLFQGEVEVNVESPLETGAKP